MAPPPLAIKETHATRTMSRTLDSINRLTVHSGLWLKLAGVLALWILTVTLSGLWNCELAERNRSQLALETSRAFFQQVVLTRQWNARHGGVYVPATGTTPPNPYLDPQGRDLRISDTLTLTKVNPAYMTRELSEIAARNSGVRFRITSLQPIRPENAPTDWEAGALHRFEQGTAELGEWRATPDGAAFHYMAPLWTEQPCLTCHAEQGYRVGDIRGGISVILPPTQTAGLQQIAVSHILVGAVGIVVILLLGWMLHGSHDRLHLLARFDMLTGIPNRRFFTERLPREFRRCRRQQAPLALILGDIDHFKRYNDTLGHQAGDECLRRIAAVLRDSARRGGDFCARFGGEEFAVVLPDTALEGGMEVAERIRAAVAALAIRHPDAPGGIVTMSLGAASNAAACPDESILIAHADQALYRAKASGRNRCVALDSDSAEVAPAPAPAPAVSMAVMNTADACFNRAIR